jgi:hypothetical protein
MLAETKEGDDEDGVDVGVSSANQHSVTGNSNTAKKDFLQKLSNPKTSSHNSQTLNALLE